MADILDELFEGELDLETLFNTTANDPFHHDAGAARTNNTSDPALTAQNESPNKRQHGDESSQDGAISPSDISPTKRQRTTNDVRPAPAPTIFPPSGNSTDPFYDGRFQPGDNMTAPAPTSLLPATTTASTYAGFNLYNDNVTAPGPAPFFALPQPPPMPVFDPYAYYKDDTAASPPSTAPTDGSHAPVAKRTIKSASGSFPQYPIVATLSAGALRSASYGASPPPGAYRPPANYERPNKNRKRWSLAKLQQFVELDAVRWKSFQKLASGFLQDPKHSERLEAVATSNKSEAQSAAKQRMDEILEEFLDDEDIGLAYFGRGVDSNGGNPRTWHWPDNKAAAKAAVECLFTRNIKAYRVIKGNAARNAKASTATDTLTPAATDASTAPSPAAPGTDFTSRVHCMGMKDGVYQKVLPRMDAAVKEVESYAGVLDQVETALRKSHIIELWSGAKDADVHKAEIWLHGPNGLMQIKSASDWEDSLAVVQATWWMDNELKLVFCFNRE